MVTTDMSGSIDQFLASLTVNGLSPNTVRAYKSDLNGWWMEWCPKKEATTYEDPRTGTTEEVLPVYTREELENLAAAYLTSHRESWSPSTTLRRLACLKKFGEWMGWPNFLATYKGPKKARGVAHPLPGGVDSLYAMYYQARKPEHKCLVVLCGFLGLRCGEALKVRPSDINMENMTLLVKGKGDKQRIVPIHDKALEMLLPRLVYCWEGDSLLIPLHDRTARRAWTSMGKRAGLQTSSHDGRMTFGTVSYVNSGGDLRAVQELLGHSQSTTTENYTDVTMDKMRQAADIL